MLRVFAAAVGRETPLLVSRLSDLIGVAASATSAVHHAQQMAGASPPTRPFAARHAPPNRCHADRLDRVDHLFVSAGLQLMRSILRCFRDAEDPFAPGCPLLQQYQAQISAAIRGVFPAADAAEEGARRLPLPTAVSASIDGEARDFPPPCRHLCTRVAIRAERGKYEIIPAQPALLALRRRPEGWNNHCNPLDSESCLACLVLTSPFDSWWVFVSTWLVLALQANIVALFCQRDIHQLPASSHQLSNGLLSGFAWFVFLICCVHQLLFRKQTRVDAALFDRSSPLSAG